MIKKEIKEINGIKYFLVGKDKEGKKVWLRNGEFACDWYWSFGGLHTFNNRNTLSNYVHFDTAVLDENRGCYAGAKNFFSDTVLTEGELWEFMELMKSFYIACQYAEMLYCGGAHITKNKCSEIIENASEWHRLNEVVIPAIIEKVVSMLID